MQILLINHYAVPPSQPGGTRHAVLGRELVQRGHDVTIVAASVNYMTEQRYADAGVNHDGVRFHLLPTRGGRRTSASRAAEMLSFAARLRRLRPAEVPDVVVGSSPHLLAAAGAARLAKRMGTPFVFELRDIWPQSLIDLGSYSRAHPAIRGMRAVERRLYRKADIVMAIMPNAADHVAAAGGDPARIRWVPNAADADAVPAGPPREAGPFTLVYAGAHGLANDLGTLLEAAALLQTDLAGVRLRLVGDGPLKPALQDRARELGLRNVEFRAAVARRQLAAELHAADAFVLPLKDAPVFRYGVSPNKLFDYLLAERPVIAAVRGGAPPVVDSGAGLAVPPGNPAALADAVRWLAALPAAERTRMGELGRRHVLENYSAGSVADRFEAALWDAVAAR